MDLLGKAIFKGLRDPSILILPIELDSSTIFWFNILHLVVSLVIGLIVVGLVKLTEQQSTNKYIILLILIMGFVATVSAIGFFTSELRVLLPWWSIITANLLAVIVTCYYMIKKHPGIVQQINPFHND